MKKSKKLISVLACTLIISMLTACGSDDSSMDQNDMTDNGSVNSVTSGADRNDSAPGTENGASGTDKGDNDDGAASDVIDGVADGVDDVTDGIADGVDDVTDGIENAVDNGTNGTTGNGTTGNGTSGNGAGSAAGTGSTR